jgi:Chromatin assembly factor 1 subunit A
LKSKVVTGRCPFKCDNAINYDLDSEEEMAEAQGEDLISN